MELMEWTLTVFPVPVAFQPEAKASTPKIVAISWTRLRVSLVVVEAERIWESLAWRRG